jgi:uncharacterized protein with HEPN domain
MTDQNRIIIDYLNDIFDSILKIKLFLENENYTTFNEDIKTQYAVIRALEIIGEASKKIPKDFKDNYSWIPWRLMTGMRDKLIHDYFGVDIQVVWKTANEDILKLEKDIKQIISDYSK